VRILEKNIPFARIVAANCDPHHYVTEQLIEANSEFGTWAYVALSKEDVLKVWLPAHGEAGLPEGSVAAAVAHFQLFHPDCREKIARLVENSCPVLMLSCAYFFTECFQDKPLVNALCGGCRLG
jgi:hypothetical protein